MILPLLACLPATSPLFPSHCPTSTPPTHPTACTCPSYSHCTACLHARMRPHTKPACTPLACLAAFYHTYHHTTTFTFHIPACLHPATLPSLPFPSPLPYHHSFHPTCLLLLYIVPSLSSSISYLSPSPSGQCAGVGVVAGSASFSPTFKH